MPQRPNQRPTPPTISRRSLLSGAGAAALAASGGFLAAGAQAQQAEQPEAGIGPDYKTTNNRIKQSVCHWCFEPMPLEELARAAAAMGLQSVELIEPKDWPILKKYGLVCAISPSHGFWEGFANPAQHDKCIDDLRKSIDATSDAGWPNVITFTGIHEIDKAEGQKNTIAGLKKIIGYAEEKKVNLCLEMLNTRVDVEMKGHPGYVADEIEWCIEVCKQIGSPRMKILFDIYHVQIMQGDVITRIKKFHEYIAHYHTAGNPGRHEIEDDQEINYPGVMKAIVETGYQGYVGQEFIPTSEDKLAPLRRAAKLCDV